MKVREPLRYLVMKLIGESNRYRIWCFYDSFPLDFCEVCKVCYIYKQPLTQSVVVTLYYFVFVTYLFDYQS